MMKRTNTAAQRKLPSKQALYIAFTVLAAALIIVVAAALKIASNNESFESFYQLALQSYAEGDYNAALSQIRKAEAIEQRYETDLIKADCYRELGYYEKALAILRSHNTDEPQIAYRIAEINTILDAMLSAEQVLIGGTIYNIGITSLALDEAGLSDSDLEDIVKLYALSSLSVSTNRLTDISPLAALGGLTSLNLSYNSVSDLSALSAAASLRTLYLDGNPITDFSPLYSLPNLSTLSIRGIELSEQQRKELSQALPNCAIHSDATSSEVTELSIGGVSFSADVTELDLSGRSLSDISSLSACKKLTTLNLSYNNIRDLTPLMDIPTLQYLNIDGNQVSDLRPLMGMISLISINAENNSITTITPLSMLTRLNALYLGSNNITDYTALTKLRNLETLGLEDTGLTDEQLAGFKELTNLRLLMISDNKELTGNAVDDLQKQITNCRITHSELPYYVEINGTRYLDDSVDLDLSNCDLSDISFLAKFRKLQTLKLSSNRLTMLYDFDWMDCSSITFLDLSSNYLTDINSIINFTNLETLVLTGNQISNPTPLYALQNLRVLHIEQNSISEESLLALRNALPNCVIYADA